MMRMSAPGALIMAESQGHVSTNVINQVRRSM
jgi:hypothetical protein